MARHSKKFSESAARIGRAGLLVAAAILIFGASGFAQFGATPSGSGSQAAQLPLSGRSGQNGGATAAQTTVPGTTTSVDTLNPVIQVQGPYTGSASSTAAMPAGTPRRSQRTCRLCRSAVR